MNQLQHPIISADHRPPNAFTPCAVAVMLGVKPSTVYAWLSRKELRGNKIGRNRFITQQQLKEFSDHRATGEYVDYTYAPR